jgi:hypothetical protein
MAKRKNIVDELAELRYHIKRLKADEKVLAGRAIDKLGIGTHDGTKAVGTVYESDRGTVNWKLIAEKLKATDAMIRKHTKHTTTTIIRVTAKLAS